MSITITTDHGDIEIKPKFRLSRGLLRQLKALLQQWSKQAYPIEQLQKQIKRQYPAAGTPQGAIVAYLTAKDWSQKELSRRTGVSQAHISEMIHGKRPIGVTIAKKLGKAFRVDYRRFL